MKKVLSDNTRLWLLIIIIFLVGGISFSLFTWLLIVLKWRLIIIFVGYFVLVSITTRCIEKEENRFIQILDRVLSAPLVVVFFLLRIAQPFITIIGTYLFVFIYAFGVLFLALLCCSHLGWLDLKIETIAFVVIATGSILCSTCYGFTRWVLRKTPLRDWGEHKYESYREKLAFYLLRPDIVVFLMYLLYFLYLGVSGRVISNLTSYGCSYSEGVLSLHRFYKHAYQSKTN